MRLFRKESISFEEKTYEIRAYHNDTIINVVAFLNNHPSNGFRYQIHLPKKCNIQEILNELILDELIETAKKDVTERRWDRVSKIIQKNMTTE